jgi:hypothetical protein
MTGGGDGRGATPVLQAAARRRNLQAQRDMSALAAVGLYDDTRRAAAEDGGAVEASAAAAAAAAAAAVDKAEVFNGVGEAVKEQDLGRAVQVDIIKTRAGSAYGFNA